MEQVVAEGQSGLAPLALLHLGELLEADGDVVGAREAYHRVVDSGEPELATIATRELLRLTDMVAEDSPLLPALLPADWDISTWEAHFRPLVIAGRHVASVMFGHMTARGLEVRTVRSDSTMEAIEAEAIEGLRQAGLSWQRPFRFAEVYGGPPLDMSWVLTCTGHSLAASGVLDATLLREAQRLLDCRRIIVSFPGRGSLLAVSADLQAEQLNILARTAALQYETSTAPVSHLLCYATDGVLDGIHEGSDALLAEPRPTYAQIVGDDVLKSLVGSQLRRR